MIYLIFLIPLILNCVNLTLNLIQRIFEDIDNHTQSFNHKNHNLSR
jgi:hypothetical protein